MKNSLILFCFLFTISYANKAFSQVPKKLDTIKTILNSGQPLLVDEQIPEFPGGSDALIKYLKKNAKYPSKARKNNIQGTVIAKFVVNKDGSISDIKIAEGIDKKIDAQVVRTIKKMPKWKPGTQNGKPVPVIYTMPVKFSLK
jgi:TonB family protein